nr:MULTISPECIES: hypothetical protein [unclassified Bradyrhizobium]
MHSRSGFQPHRLKESCGSHQPAGRVAPSGRDGFVIIGVGNRIQAAERVNDSPIAVAIDWGDEINAQTPKLAGDFAALGERAHLLIRLDLPTIDPDLKPDEVRVLPERNVEGSVVVGVGLIQILQRKSNLRRV